MLQTNHLPDLDTGEIDAAKPTVPPYFNPYDHRLSQPSNWSTDFIANTMVVLLPEEEASQHQMSTFQIDESAKPQAVLPAHSLQSSDL